jgi:OmcA/MtrC family decaheme c-type cytochrome
VVNFTVFDGNNNPAVGIDVSALRFTFAKLVPPSPDFNGGIAYWQSYINRAATSDQPGGVANAVQATNERGGELDELGEGEYVYTFSNDVTNITDPIAVAWEPNLTHRVGMEIRLDGPGEVPLAPFNPVYDFVPDGGAGSGVTKKIAALENCAGCHFEFALHGGPRKSVDYCVTCHNPGSVDPDSGESVDMAYLAHSIHMGADRATPYIIYGFGGSENNYGEVHYPQSQTYCETCHVESQSHPDGDAWNESASAKTCGGCHADGLVAQDFDPVTGQAEYYFDHSLADADLGLQADSDCAGCHTGAIPTAGPALSIHSRISGDQRFREALGANFVFEVLAATNTGPGETPVITFKVSRADGTAYDILNDPEFTDSASSFNLYVSWPGIENYNGDELGNTGGYRDRNRDTSEPPDGIPDIQYYGAGHPNRMELAALRRDITANPDWVNADGSYTVTYFTALPESFTGNAMISMGGHPAAVDVLNADNELSTERAAAVSATFFSGVERKLAVDSAKCSVCHQQIQFHGANRNGNVTMCINCHNADLTEGDEGFALGRMIHSIHAASPTFAGGEFADLHLPQSVANCTICHEDGAYNVARNEARAVSTGAGADAMIWTDDTATTPTAASCGNCHTSGAAQSHFLTQGGQVDALKCEILGAECGAADGSSGSGLPNGQEACAVCHKTGAAFETAKYHNPGLSE